MSRRARETAREKNCTIYLANEKHFFSFTFKCWPEYFIAFSLLLSYTSMARLHFELHGGEERCEREKSTVNDLEAILIATLWSSSEQVRMIIIKKKEKCPHSGIARWELVNTNVDCTFPWKWLSKGFETRFREYFTVQCSAGAAIMHNRL